MRYRNKIDLLWQNFWSLFPSNRRASASRRRERDALAPPPGRSSGRRRRSPPRREARRRDGPALPQPCRSMRSRPLPPRRPRPPRREAHTLAEPAPWCLQEEQGLAERRWGVRTGGPAERIRPPTERRWWSAPSLLHRFVRLARSPCARSPSSSPVSAMGHRRECSRRPELAGWNSSAGAAVA
jgi:hypothetical protein